MDGWRNTYVDLARVPAIGALLVDVRPAFVFAADGSRVLWTNAAGATFLGARSIEAAVEDIFSTLNPIRAQAARLARLLPSETARLEMLRFGRGVAVITLAAACRRLNLPRDQRAVLAVAVAGAASSSLAARAEMLAQVLGTDARPAAILDSGGRLLAASGDGVPAGGDDWAAVPFTADGRDLQLLLAGPAPEAPPAPPPAAAVAAPEPAAPAPVAAQAPIPPAAARQATEPPADPPLPAEPVAAPAPVRRFAWAMDAAHRFTFVSPDLAETVGALNAAIVGHTWADVSERLGLDVARRVDAALAAGDGFAVAVHWPDAHGGDSVAVDLSGWAAAGGHHGFGFIRVNDRQPDTRIDKGGLPAATRVAAPDPAPTADVDADARRSVEEGPLRLVASTSPDALARSNVVRLSSSERPRAVGEPLSGVERDAFRRIAEALKPPAETAEGPAETAVPPEPPVVRDAAGDFDARLLDRLPVGIVIFRDRRTLFANRTLVEMLGYPSYEAFMAAGGADAIFPGGDDIAASIAEAGGNVAAVRNDGSAIPVDAKLHAVPFAGATALMLTLTEASADETAMAGALARSQTRAGELEAILDTATDGVVVVDVRGKIGSMNRAAEALFGVNADDYRGRYFTDLLADESQKSALDYLDGLAANGVASVLNDGREVIGRVPQGGLIPLFMTMGRLAGTDKFCAVLRDITHWKNVEEELVAARRTAEAANQQKSDFLAKISHEIRTPLNAIIGFSEVMMEERFGPIGNPRYRDYLRDIHVSGAHLMSLINDLLDLSKIEAGKLELSFESVAVNASIQECVALMQPQANRERIIIRTSLASELPNVVADPRSIRQILLNLLSNAIKFTRAGGQVIVSTTLEDSGEVSLRVRDTGIGMSEKDIEIALKPFRQVALARDDREHGTGLGLPLTKALVEANRATFAIESAPNQGTLVKIAFPTTRVLAG